VIVVDKHLIEEMLNILLVMEGVKEGGEGNNIKHV
jgi:hypothetical protein